jgi:subtilisin family serine protease
MKWIFQPRPPGDPAVRDDYAGLAPGMLGLPTALLERHGARVLHPGHAGEVHGFAEPRSTVYRARTLLVPGILLRDAGFVRAVNDVLNRAGMELVPPEEDRDADLTTNGGDQEVLRVFAALRELPRPAVLVPLEGYPRPVDIDAWTALQTLRAATARGDRPTDDASATRENKAADDASAAQPPLDKAKVDRIELEHLLIGSAITGSPIDGGPGGIAGGSGNGSDTGGPSSTDSYLFNGGEPCTPVAVLLRRPRRRPEASCVSRYGRRPVVAVLDTGGCAHPWLGVTAAPGGGNTMAADSFVKTDDAIQAAIRDESQWAAQRGDRRRQVIEDAWDKPLADNPLIGELNAAYGHGGFIAGIVRQVAPDAQVLAVRCMHSDDVMYEGDIICALHRLAKRIVLAEPDDPAAKTDVVSMSFGYFSESRHDQMVTSGLWRAITVLLGLGVAVVAAAGNYASSRRFYPAAFALEAVPPGEVPVISVGALNVNGTKAMFSNDSRWVTAWAAGACVVSTYPTDANGSRTPELRIPVGEQQRPGQYPLVREALDPDDYSAGFALWSGTSFSAPYAAALFAKSLLKGAMDPGGALKLDLAGIQARKGRAVAAYQGLPRSIP